MMIFVTCYGWYFVFFMLVHYSLFNSMNVSKVIFKFPNFYLVLFLIVHIEFIFLFYYSFNFIDNSVNLLRKYFYDKQQIII